jgi:hypothetical protein
MHRRLGHGDGLERRRAAQIENIEKSSKGACAAVKEAAPARFIWLNSMVGSQVTARRAMAWRG